MARLCARYPAQYLACALSIGECLEPPFLGNLTRSGPSWLQDPSYKPPDLQDVWINVISYGHLTTVLFGAFTSSPARAAKLLSEPELAGLCMWGAPRLLARLLLLESTTAWTSSRTTPGHYDPWVSASRSLSHEGGVRLWILFFFFFSAPLKNRSSPQQCLGNRLGFFYLQGQD